jgi:hypothetical protein
MQCLTSFVVEPQVDGLVDPPDHASIQDPDAAVALFADPSAKQAAEHD